MASKFDDLRKALPGAEILVPGDPGYEDSLKRWSVSCIKPAAVVVRPNNASEVSVALRYATKHGVLPLAICGGGHNTGGDSSSDGGMVIDLFRMRSTSVDPQAETITFGGGCTWEDVNGALWEHGLATVSGTVADTGVGGLILCGGYGYLTGRRGLALDCLLRCEVVLANGAVVIASKDENADLFWALRGAGPNFGVVTSFTSQAYPQGDCWAGFLAYTPEKLGALIEFGNQFSKRTPESQCLAFICRLRVHECPRGPIW
jgi:FAD/FMN-containing dehydrogenase